MNIVNSLLTFWSLSSSNPFRFTPNLFIVMLNDDVIMMQYTLKQVQLTKLIFVWLTQCRELNQLRLDFPEFYQFPHFDLV